MDFEKQRILMVERQLEPRGISDRAVLAAMAMVPREKFIPEDLQHLSYVDAPVPIDCAQTISQPYIVAYMLEVLNLRDSDHVLEIGTGSGYNAAVLSDIVDEVTTIELIPALAQEAKAKLPTLGYFNVDVIEGDGRYGHINKAPFDAIIVTAASQEVPQELFNQLKMGGKLVAPVGDGSQHLNLYRKDHDGIHKTLLMPVRFVPLVDRQFLIDKEIIRK